MIFDIPVNLYTDFIGAVFQINPTAVVLIWLAFAVQYNFKYPN
jgi:hypothetical protein